MNDPNQPVRILVIDDDDLLRAAATRVLERAGYEVRDAATGSDGLALATSLRPALVLLDMMLPDLDGAEVCRRLKAEPSLADTYVVIVSAHKTELDHQLLGLASGADDYVVRPIGNQELLARVEIGLTLRRQRLDVQQARDHVQAILEAAPMPLWELDLDGKVKVWNPAAEATFGWPTEAVVGHRLPAVAPESRDAFQTLCRRVAAGTIVRGTEIVLRREDGSHLAVLLSAAPLHEPTGRVVGLVMATQAITDIKALQKSLRAQADEERHFQMRLRSLMSVGNTLTLTASVDELCRQAVTLGRERLGFERMGIWLRDPSAPNLMRGTWGIDEAGDLRDEHTQMMPVDSEIIAWSASSGMEVLHQAESPLMDDRSQIVGTGMRARALMRDGDDFLGVISVDNLLTGHPITEQDRNLLNLYAVMVGNLCVRKRAEAALRERERFYRTLFETTGAATLVLNEDMTPLAVNAEMAALSGFTRKELESSRMGILDLVAPEFRDLVRERHIRRREEPGDIPNRYTVQMVNRQGELRDVVIYVNMIPGTRRSVVSFLDITVQQAALARAKASATQQRAINAIIMHAAAASDLYELLDVTLKHTLRALDASGGFCWVEGRRAGRGLFADLNEDMAMRLSDLCGRHPVLVMQDCPKDATEADSEVWSSLGVGAMICAGIDVPEDGGESGALTGSPGLLLVASDQPRVWSDEEVALVEAVARQLSSAVERLALLDQVRRQAQRLQHVIDTVPEGVVVLGTSKSVMLANADGRDHLEFLARIGDEGRVTRLGDQDLDTLLAPPPYGHHEVTHNDRYFEVIARPLTDVHHLEGWVMVLRDITESKVMAERLRQQDRLAAVGRLAAGIAHDFNNIMSVVVLYAQLAQRNLGQEEETAREQMRVIHDQALQATKLIEQILDFSRKAPLERRPMSLLPYLKEIMKLWQRTLPENIDIVLDVTDVETLRVSADPTRIQQALMNLATNARDAMPKGGTLRIKVRRADYARASDVPLPDMSPGAWVRLDFVDTGVGIPSDVLSHVFEPFYTTKTTGSGLGLAQVHGIVKQHGGEVDIESEVGAGTRVTIYLPLLVEAPPASIPAPAMQEMPLGQGKQVLVVEDNAKTREALAAALDALNYRSITVRNGREALEALVRWGDEIDVILTDAVMPEMGAAELLQTLASKQLSFPVIVLSGYLEPEQREKLRETGPLVTWLTKPVDLLDLASALSHALPNDRAS